MITIPWVRRAIWAGVLVCSLGACTKEEKPEPVLSVIPETLNFTNGVTLQSFEISTNRTWTLDAGDASWISVSPRQGDSGKSTVQVTVEPNPSFAQRTCELSIKIPGQKASCTVHQASGLEAPEGSEQAALIALYNSLNGPNWKARENWLSDKPIGQWEGIRTDEQGHVLVIYMYANNLSGEIPEEIGDLPYLEKLYFSHDAVRGGIPESIGKLKNLQILDFTVNNLTGNIPSSITGLPRLQTLALNDNSLSGPIPEEIGLMAELRSMTLHKNRLSGSLPESIGNLRQAETINLSHNSLSGPLPESMGNLEALTSLQVQRNLFTGGLPAGF